MPRLSPFKLGESMVRQLGLDGYLPGFVLKKLARDLDQDWWISLHVPEEISPCGQGGHVEVPLIKPTDHPAEPLPTDGEELGTSPSGLLQGGQEHPASIQGVCVKLGPMSQPGTIKTKSRIQFAVGEIEMQVNLEWEIAFRVLDPIWRSLRCGQPGCVEEEYIATLRATHRITGTINLELDITSSALGALPSTYSAKWNGLRGIGKWDLTLIIDGERVREDDLSFLVNRYQVRPLPANSALAGSGTGTSPAIASSSLANPDVPGNTTWIANSRDCEVRFSLLADGTSKAYQGGRADIDWEAIVTGPDGNVRQRRIRTVKFNQTDRQYTLPALTVPKACEPGFWYQNKFTLTLYDSAGTLVGRTDWFVDDGQVDCGNQEGINRPLWLNGDTRLGLMFWIESSCK